MVCAVHVHFDAGGGKMTNMNSGKADLEQIVRHLDEQPKMWEPGLKPIPCLFHVGPFVLWSIGWKWKTKLRLFPWVGWYINRHST